MDSHLTMKFQIEKTYKKATNRVKLQQLIPPSISTVVAKKIYSVMTRPIRLYCYPLYLSISESAKIKSKSVQNKAHKIIALNKNKEVKIETLDQIRKKRVSLDIFRSLNVAWLLPLRNLFKRQAHKRHTRKRFASVSTKGKY